MMNLDQPVPRTTAEKKAFERWWDAEFERRNPEADNTHINRIMGLTLPGR